MAPEFLENKNVHFTEKTEVFSFGVLLWEIFSDPRLAREGPYPNLQPVQILFQVVNSGLRPKIVRDSPIADSQQTTPQQHLQQTIITPKNREASNKVDQREFTFAMHQASLHHSSTDTGKMLP